MNLKRFNQIAETGETAAKVVQVFKDYDAVLLYRSELPERFPAAFAAIERLVGNIDQQEMLLG